MIDTRVCVYQLFLRICWVNLSVVSGQTKTFSEAKIILLVHKITGYGTINKIHMLQNTNQ